MSGYAFHPEAFADLEEIWDHLAADSIDAADRVLSDCRIDVGNTLIRSASGDSSGDAPASSDRG